MTPRSPDSSKKYRFRSCPHCGGSLYWDDEEKIWRCLNCGRPLGEPVSTTDKAISTDNNSISTTETPPKSAETPAISKGRRSPTPHRQMLILIKSLPQLREGRWPADPVGADHVDLPIIKKGRAGKHHAYFETPAATAAEIEARLEKCGIDGLILLAIEAWGESEASLVNYFSMPTWSLRKRAKNALRYISGGERKKQSYKESLR